MDGKRDDVLYWWVVMQSYGAPTRLLGWSWSPYVAACFAVEKGWSQDEDKAEGAIWAFDVNARNQAVLRQGGNPELTDWKTLISPIPVAGLFAVEGAGRATAEAVRIAAAGVINLSMTPDALSEQG